MIRVGYSAKKERPLTDWHLFAKVIPITPNVCLHHFAAHYMAIITTVAFQKSFFLPRNWCVISLIESLFDQVDNLLALFFGQHSFWKASIKEARDSHRMLWLLVGREETRKITIIGKGRSIVLILCIWITVKILARYVVYVSGTLLTWRRRADPFES